MRPSKFLQLISYLFPIRLLTHRLNTGKKLKLVLYKNQYQLAYGRVFYSDGVDYFPFRKTFKETKKIMESKEKILVLGAGIGSVGMILNEFFPNKKWQLDFVDIEPTILKWCEMIMMEYKNLHCKFFQADAIDWVKHCQEKYDVITVDVFEESRVPEAILTESFLEKIKTAIQENGIIIMNLMFEEEAEKENFLQKVSQVFPAYKPFQTKLNTMLILFNNKIQNSNH